MPIPAFPINDDETLNFVEYYGLTVTQQSEARNWLGKNGTAAQQREFARVTAQFRKDEEKRQAKENEQNELLRRMNEAPNKHGQNKKSNCSIL